MIRAIATNVAHLEPHRVTLIPPPVGTREQQMVLDVVVGKYSVRITSVSREGNEKRKEELHVLPGFCVRLFGLGV